VKPYLVGTYFSPDEVKIILSISLSSTNQEDIMLWRGTAKEDFSVRLTTYKKRWKRQTKLNVQPGVPVVMCGGRYGRCMCQMLRRTFFVKLAMTFYLHVIICI
jgi:hypothetical protein